jgi:hypothetical protein
LSHLFKKRFEQFARYRAAVRFTNIDSGHSYTCREELLMHPLFMFIGIAG